MPCFYPIKGYRDKRRNENGKREIKFRRMEGLVDREVELPCGKCDGCRMDKSREWALRCIHEARMHDKSCFVTLTYNKENLPDDESISRDVLQNFLKRLRKRICYIDYRCNCAYEELGHKHLKKGKSQTLVWDKIRYFGCGEYGDKKGRPHYHIAIFGWEPHDCYDGVSTNSGHVHFKSKILERCWSNEKGELMGFVSVGSLTQASAGYIARYVTKKQGNAKKFEIEDEYGNTIEKVSEFAIMSKGRREAGEGGIGYTWFKKFKDDCRKDFITVDGSKYPVPKYYRTLMEEYDREIERRNKRRRKINQKKEKDRGEMDQRRLEAKERILQSRMKRLPREMENGKMS